ncbi:hypothetical protein C8R47DRAFT_1077383 [Mycena vitilis]|nr:hypothetical protein C8R47DRAFT_1077383 [Mycena vitilis]
MARAWIQQATSASEQLTSFDTSEYVDGHEAPSTEPLFSGRTEWWYPHEKGGGDRDPNSIILNSRPNPEGRDKKAIATCHGWGINLTGNFWATCALCIESTGLLRPMIEGHEPFATTPGVAGKAMVTFPSAQNYPRTRMLGENYWENWNMKDCRAMPRWIGASTPPRVTRLLPHHRFTVLCILPVHPVPLGAGRTLSHLSRGARRMKWINFYTQSGGATCNFKLQAGAGLRKLESKQQDAFLALLRLRTHHRCIYTRRAASVALNGGGTSDAARRLGFAILQPYQHTARPLLWIHVPGGDDVELLNREEREEMLYASFRRSYEMLPRWPALESRTSNAHKALNRLSSVPRNFVRATWMDLLRCVHSLSQASQTRNPNQPFESLNRQPPIRRLVIILVLVQSSHIGKPNGGWPHLRCLECTYGCQLHGWNPFDSGLGHRAFGPQFCPSAPLPTAHKIRNIAEHYPQVNQPGGTYSDAAASGSIVIIRPTLRPPRLQFGIEISQVEQHLCWTNDKANNNDSIADGPHLQWTLAR